MSCAALALAIAVWGCPKPAAESGADGATAKPAEPSGPPPQITCEAPKHDFGSVHQETDLTHTFVVKNTGQGVLKIDKAKGS
jgi:hypothetical protein